MGIGEHILGTAANHWVMLLCMPYIQKEEKYNKLSLKQHTCIFINPLITLSWASLVAQLVENPPAMQETWVRSLGWEDPLEKGKVTHSSILAWRIPGTV